MKNLFQYLGKDGSKLYGSEITVLIVKMQAELYYVTSKVVFIGQ